MCPEGSEVGRNGFLEEKTPWDLTQASEVDGFGGRAEVVWPLWLQEESSNVGITQ